MMQMVFLVIKNPVIVFFPNNPNMQKPNQPQR